MKKILFTVSALFIGTLAFGQEKKDVQLEKRTVQEPQKNNVRVVKKQVRKEKAGPTQRQTPVRKEETTPAKDEKKTK